MPYSINKFLLFVVLGVDHLEDLLRRCGISAILESASLLKTYSSECKTPKHRFASPPSPNPWTWWGSTSGTQSVDRVM